MYKLRQEVVKNLIGRTFKSIVTTAKIQRLSCFITIIVLPGLDSPFTTDLFQEEARTFHVNMLHMLLRHDFTLALETPWGVREGVRKYYDLAGSLP